MLWTLRSPSARHLQRCLARPFSSTRSLQPKPKYKGTTRTSASSQALAWLNADATILEQSLRIREPAVLKHIAFTFFGSLACFLLAAQMCNIDTAEQEKMLLNTSIKWMFWPPTSDDLRQHKRRAFTEGLLQASYDDLWDATSHWPNELRNIVLRAYVQVLKPLVNDTDGGTRVCWALCATQVLVWAAWKVSRFQPFMTKHFTHRPLSRIPYTLLTSAFSHRSSLHLMANCICLASVGPTAAAYLTREQAKTSVGIREADVTWHFLAFYSTSCLCSSLVSHVMLTKVKYPISIVRLLLRRKVPSAPEVAKFSRNLKRAADRTMLPTSGSSGAVSAVMMLAALASDAETSDTIPLVPTQLQRVAGVSVTMSFLSFFDRLRSVNPWVYFGGSVVGALYYYGGISSWWGDLRKVLPYPTG